MVSLIILNLEQDAEPYRILMRLPCMEKKKLNLSAIKALRTYPWPGNVRELKDVILFAAFHTQEDTITKEDITFFQSEPEVPDVLTLKNEDIEKSR